MRAVIHAIAASTALMPLALQAETVAIMPVKLLDTSYEARDQEADHDRRLVLLAEVIRTELDDAAIIGGESVAACKPQTPECLLALTREAGADRALFIVAVKTSTLILQLFANLVETEDGTLIMSREFSFRGDNDEAWRRAGRFLARQMAEAAD